MRIRMIALFLMAGILFLAAGCSKRESDEVAFILAMGIDAAPNKEVTVTYQYAVPRAIAPEGGGATKPTEYITITAANLAEARNLLNTTISRTVDLSHVKTMVIGDELARRGLSDIIAPLVRFTEFRGSIFLGIVHQDTAHEFITSNSPVLEIFTSRYYEAFLSTYTQTALFLPTNLHLFYSRLKSNSGSPYVTLFGINKLTGTGEKAGEKMPEEKSDEHLAGQIPRKPRGNPVEALGTAIFRKDKMVGVLTSEETRALGLLTKQMKQSFLIIADPQVPEKGINILIRLGRDPKLDVKIEDGQATITADILVEGNITSIPSGIQYETGEIKQQLEQQMTKVLQAEIAKMLKKTQDWGCDVVGFGYIARTQYRTYDDFMETDWSKMYRDAKIDLKVTARIRRSSLMWQTSPVK